MFRDTDALSLGRAVRLVPSYIEHYHRWEPLAQLIARCRPTAAGHAHVLDHTRPYLTDENRLFLDRHLYQGGLHAVLCTEGGGAAAYLALVVFDERESAFDARDIAIVQRLGRLLTRQAELLLGLPPAPTGVPGLSRQGGRGGTSGRPRVYQPAGRRRALHHRRHGEEARQSRVRQGGAANRAELAARMAGAGA